MICSEIFPNCMIRPLKLTLLTYRSKNEWSVVPMVTGLPSDFYLEKLDNFTGTPQNFMLWTSVLYLGSNDFSKQLADLLIYEYGSPLKLGDFFFELHFSVH